MEVETARVRVTIPREFVATVDELVGKHNRATFIVQAVADKMERDRKDHALEPAARSLTADSYPEGDKLEKPSA